MSETVWKILGCPGTLTRSADSRRHRRALEAAGYQSVEPVGWVLENGGLSLHVFHQAYRSVAVDFGSELQNLHLPLPQRLLEFFTSELTQDKLDSIEMKLFLRKMTLAQRLLKQPLEERQVMDIFNSVLVTAVPVIKSTLLQYQVRWEAARLVCEELKGEPAAHAPVQPEAVPSPAEDETCICCLDAERSYYYQPCKHNVCCRACAEHLYTRSDCCPWCRAEVEPVV